MLYITQITQGVAIALAIMTTAFVSMGVAFAQEQNLTKLIEEKYTNPHYTGGSYYGDFPDIYLDYDSPNTIVFHGNLYKDFESLIPNDSIWNATDMFKNEYGFKVTHIIKDGLGTEDSQGRAFIVMEK